MHSTHADTQYDLFVSYSSKDLPAAEALNSRLVGAGFKVWFDKARLQSGCDWHKEIEAGCKQSRVLMPVLTPHWKDSKWTRYETYGAEAVLPLHAEGDLDEVLTPPLRRTQLHKLDPLTASDAEWDELFAAVRRLLAQPRVEKGERTAHLRYRTNPHFVGRESDLLQLHEALFRGPTAALTQGGTISVHAMGGVGKTTLAREYAEHYWRCYQQMLWVDARADLLSEFARLAEIFDPRLKEVTDLTEKANFALRVLGEQTERLLIVDNVEDEESIQRWIPKAGGCHTIITSRFAGWSSAVQTLHVYVLEPEPARELLLQSSGRTAETEAIQSVDDLAKELGYLPLALEQAAAFVREEGVDFTFADYLQLYQKSQRELLAEGVLGSTEYPDSVMTTWRATLDRLRDNTLARAILRLCAFYASTPIPQAMLERSFDDLLAAAELLAGEPTDSTNSTGTPSPQSASPEMAIRRALKDLARYSMIDRYGHDFGLHNLVQTVQRLEIPCDAERTWIKAALDIVNAHCPGDPPPDDVRSWPIWTPLEPHVETILTHADRAGITEPTSRLMNDFGLFLAARTRYAAAEQWFRRALAIDEASFGPEHPKVAIRLNNLAQLLKATNRLAKAEPLMRRALASDEASFGPEHPKVASHLNNLASLLKETSRLAEAEPLMRRALAIDEASFGPDHPNVARDLNNLAGLLEATNRLAEAEPLMRRALAIDETSFGPEHPKVATDLNNLAQLLQATNRLAEAEPLYRRALAIWEESLGSDHPQVAIGLNNLATLLKATNRLAEAEPLMRRALAIDEASFGPEHPHIARDLNNLAQLLQATNRLAEAEPLMRRALAIDEASFGPEHPNVAIRLSNLASLLQATNRLVEAEPLMRRALAIDEASFGPEHPDVAIDLNNLAGLLRATNRLAEAEPLMRRMVTIFCDFTRRTGHPHPHLFDAIGNYWSLLEEMNVPKQDRFQRLLTAGVDPTWFQKE